MSSRKRLVLSLLAIAAAAPLARAAEAPPAASPAQQAANTDFGMLSKQGAVAFRDVGLARLAIFDGQPEKAKQFVASARTALDKARTDAAAYTRAESDLTPPPGMTEPKGGTALDGPVRWLPVNGALTVGEDFAATPAKKAGMAKADEQVRHGDRKGALETLRLAGVNVTFDMEVIPLEQSITELGNAATLVNSGMYYEANQALKTVQDGARFDVETYTGTPVHGAPAGAAAATPAPAAKGS